MSRPTLLYYSEDAGDVYGFWQWLDRGTGEPRGFRIARDTITPLGEELRAALPTRLAGETLRAAIDRMLATGALTSAGRERRFSQRLRSALLPDELAGEILDAAVEGTPVLRMLPAASCAAFPWELLLLGDEGSARRLIDLVDIVADPPAGVHAGRSRIPRRYSGGADAVHLIDPAPAGGGMGRILTDEQRDALLAVNPGTWSGSAPESSTVTRADLSQRLRAEHPPSRMLYVGHVVSPESHAGATSLLLSDPAAMYGVLPVVDGMRPFSALDLLEGTLFATQRLHETPLSFPPPDELIWPSGRNDSLPGHDIWPMPPRVALIACDSGADLGRSEPFGLAIACINAGAEIVTATRWTLPTDRAFRRTALPRPGRDPQPLFDMVAAVDEAHRGRDAISSIAAWQRTRAAEWDSAGTTAPAWLSPITWSALTSFAAPRRPTIPLTADEVAELSG